MRIVNAICVTGRIVAVKISKVKWQYTPEELLNIKHGESNSSMWTYKSHTAYGVKRMHFLIDGLYNRYEQFMYFATVNVLKNFI